MIRRRVAAWKLDRERVALERGRRDGHRDYTRFLILGRSRTGSNMLRSTLNEHPGGVCYGELFRRPGFIGWDRWPFVGPRVGQSRRLVNLIDTDPIRFLETWIYRVYGREIEAVGFKMFYYYAHQPAWEPVWDWLLADRQVHVLHIRRRNLLRTYLSHVHASRTDRWLAGREGSKGPPPVGLDFDACRSFFEKTRAWEEEYDERFSEHPKLSLYYEDLVADFDAEMAGVQNFLGLTARPVRPLTRKQSRLPLEQAILNYDELHARFADTEWGEFFSDAGTEPAVAVARRMERT